MWAQIIKARLKPNSEAEMKQLMDEIEGETPQSPFVGSIALENQNNPGEYYTVVLFESEEAARANENTPEQQARVQKIQALYEGQPEFVDCRVVHETRR